MQSAYPAVNVRDDASAINIVLSIFRLSLRCIVIRSLQNDLGEYCINNLFRSHRKREYEYTCVRGGSQVHSLRGTRGPRLGGRVQSECRIRCIASFHVYELDQGAVFPQMLLIPFGQDWA